MGVTALPLDDESRAEGDHNGHTEPVPRFLYEPVHSPVAALIKRAERALHTRFNEELRELELSSAEYGILEAIAFLEGASAADVARTVTVTPQALTRIVANLEARELIERTPVPGSRVLRVTLTESGSALFRKAADRVMQVEAVLTSVMEPAERAVLVGLMHRAIDVLDETARD